MKFHMYDENDQPFFVRPGARPTKGISIEFEIRSKYGVL